MIGILNEETTDLSWSEFCSWPVVCDAHSIMCLWDQTLVCAHSAEDILSYSEEPISYLWTTSSLLGLIFSKNPWNYLSATQPLLLHFFFFCFCLCSYSCLFKEPLASLCLWCAMVMIARAEYIWMLVLWLHLNMEIAPDCVTQPGLQFLVSGDSLASASQVLW